MTTILESRATLNRRRSWTALIVALAVDALQFGLGPLGWVGVDQGLDVVAMVVMTALLGFHPLLLPSFILELVPVVDMFPTWTGCVLLVMATKRKEPPVPEPMGKVIDV